MPERFDFPAPLIDLWVPYAVEPATDAQSMMFDVVGRLAPGISLPVATAEANVIGEALRGPSAAGLPERRFQVVRLQDDLVDPIRQALHVLTIAVGFVFLIACANVASLLLARTMTRGNELGIRRALGATRGRLAGQLLTESLVLGGLGAIAGIGVAYVGLELLQYVGFTLQRSDLGQAAMPIPKLEQLAIDRATLAFALGAAVISVVLFGLIPALRTAFAPPTPLVTSVGRDGAARRALLGVEIMMATILLVGAGLLLRSFVNLATVPLGYDPSQVVTFQLPLPIERYPTGQAAGRFAEAIVEQIRALPNVSGAAYMDVLPMVPLRTVVPELRRTPGPAIMRGPSGLNGRLVSHNYFRTMGIATVAGRTFERTDGATAARVLVVNRALARREFGNGEAVGQQIYLFGDRPWQVVGVVDDVRQFGIDQAPEAQLFMDYRQWEVAWDPEGRGLPRQWEGDFYFAVRANGDDTALTRDIAALIRQADAELALSNVAAMEQLVANALTRPRVHTVLMAMCAAIAGLLAAIGLYGVVSYIVAGRTREIGICVVVGASRQQVLRLVLGQTGVAVGWGTLAGLAGAAAVTEYMRGMLYGVTPLDLSTFAGVTAMFLVVAAIAAFIPARKATQVDPVVALRSE